MKVFRVEGKIQDEITSNEIISLCNGYEKVVLDVGAGDAKGSLRYGKANPKTLVIALDSNPDVLTETSTKALKKPQRGGVDNLVCLYGNIRDASNVLSKVSDLTRVYLPWGDLLVGIATMENLLFDSINACTKQSGIIDVVINAEIWKNNLPKQLSNLGEITPEFFYDHSNKLLDFGISLQESHEMTIDEIKKLDTTWSAKLMSSRNMASFIRATAVVN